MTIVSASPVDEEVVRDNPAMRVAAPVPDLFTKPPEPLDPLCTVTSAAQADTINECLPFLLAEAEGLVYNENGLAGLRRGRHATFLRKWLDQRMSHHFVAVDASRPWFLYWCLEALHLLGEDVSAYRTRMVETARWMQNPAGGFGGGFGQLSHLATTYAVVLALVIVGGDEAYEVIDRRALWRWLSTLKQPDGGFAMASGGEVDVRGAYCAAVIISLLNLPLDLPADRAAQMPNKANLQTGLAEYVQRCQTYEGGISGKPDAEAHGAYTFCALGCLSILDAPYRIIPRYLDVSRLVSWLSSRQYAPEGGFSGRTNKLVDGCYSQWIGGCWPIMESCLNPPATTASETKTEWGQTLAPNQISIFSRQGLVRFILNCCQDGTPRGGLRDKPSRPSDAYHSCYVLAGLSSAQHWSRYSEQATDDRWDTSPHIFELQAFGEEDLVKALHPIYLIPRDKVQRVQEHFRVKVSF